MSFFYRTVHMNSFETGSDYRVDYFVKLKIDII